MTDERKPNRLAKEKSPYLLKHAYNPVDWYTWGDEALKKARNDGKPIFLSIGYSSCHWCNVMERESFEDDETAAFLNKNFIPIKVDREERPEVDSYYMNAVQAMTGGGGWPLSVFLTPDLKPFYGGTYFPPEPRIGIPSFRQVLEFVAKVWKEKRGEALGNAQQISEALAEGQKAGNRGELDASLLEEGYVSLAASFDQEHGGFGRAPKFPLPLSIQFMLRYNYRTGKQLALTAATKTLDEMMKGGIRDHVGGGFHRYATDRIWLVPHFEKMLYDNALLARVYIEAHQATGRSEYAQVARETLDWMLAELRDEEGGFYSAQDADTPAGEGVYYTWTPAEVEEELGGDAPAFCASYGVTRNGNFEGGRTVLRLERAVGERERWEWTRRLYQARLRRARPATDTKVLTSWNGLAISALALAGQVLENIAYLNAAEKAADFIIGKNLVNGSLLRRYAGGEAAIEGTLEDYAYFAQGLIDLFEAEGDPERLRQAMSLTDSMVDRFHDAKEGGFFMTLQAVPARMKEGYDGPTPSGNSVAASNLVRLAELSGNKKFRELADETLRYFRSQIEEQPSGHACMLAAADLLVNGMREVVVTASSREELAAMAGEVRKRFVPNIALLRVTSDNFERLEQLTPLVEGRGPGRAPAAYVCENFTCKLPAKSVEELRNQLLKSIS